MHVQVVGANGLLGSNVVARARDRGHAVSGTYHTTDPDLPISLTQFDVRDPDAVERLVTREDPDLVVNCAAMTDVDGCETDPERARAVNATAPGTLASVCRASDTRFVHVSTDYVFDGTADDPYAESAPTSPVQVYGETKREGERRVFEAMDDALVARLSFVYGIHRGTDRLAGFPAWVRDRLARGDETPLFVDQRVTPSRAGSTAETLLDLAATGTSGIYHVASRSCVTPNEFGRAIWRTVDADPALLVEGRLADVERPARRPRYTCLDVSKVETHLDRPQPTLAEDLAAIEGRLDAAE